MYLDDLRQRVADKCDIGQALLALNLSITPERLKMFKRTREMLSTATSSQLEHAEFVLDVNIQNAERHAGYKGGEKFLLELGRSHRDKKFELVEYPKVIVDRFLFDHYEKVHPLWTKIQPHALVHIDLEGKDRDLYLPEASLYEDMCFAFNQGWATDELRTKERERTKIGVKTHVFFTRASIISAYNFVECFLNGLAFDFLATARRTLSTPDRDLLSEWDSSRKKHKFVKFRDKALQYPKLILKRKTPLFTESSCPSLATLMSCINYRDAVVHNAPKLDLAGEEMPKVRALIELRFNDAVKIVDAAVEFVRTVDEAVNRGRYDNTWLLPRTAEGQFPPASFS